MRRLIASALLAFAAVSASAEELATYIFGENVFSLQLPKSWVRNNDPKYFSFSSPDKRVSLTASAYSKQDGSLEEFSQYRFSSVHEWYKPVGPAKKFKTNGATAIYREFEGVWPGESKPTYYLVACLSVGNAYASVTFTTDRKDFSANQKRYEAILRSIQPSS